MNEQILFLIEIIISFIGIALFYWISKTLLSGIWNKIKIWNLLNKEKIKTWIKNDPVGFFLENTFGKFADHILTPIVTNWWGWLIIAIIINWIYPDFVNKIENIIIGK